MKQCTIPTAAAVHYKPVTLHYPLAGEQPPCPAPRLPVYLPAGIPIPWEWVAVEAPRVSTWSFPNSFWPHAYYPGLVGVEGRLPAHTVAELERRGHQVDIWDDFTSKMGCLCAIQVDRERGTLSGGLRQGLYRRDRRRA